MWRTIISRLALDQVKSPLIKLIHQRTISGIIGRTSNPSNVITSSSSPCSFCHQYHQVRFDSTFKNVEDFENRWIKFFRNDAFDQFELQRGLNHCFNHDIIPTIPLLEEALRACRRLNDLGAAMRIFGALREKCKDDDEYESYVKHLDPIKEELGVTSPEDFGRL